MSFEIIWFPLLRVSKQYPVPFEIIWFIIQLVDSMVKVPFLCLGNGRVHFLGWLGVVEQQLFFFKNKNKEVLNKSGQDLTDNQYLPIGTKTLSISQEAFWKIKEDKKLVRTRKQEKISEWLRYYFQNWSWLWRNKIFLYVYLFIYYNMPTTYV
jgi:hypothetical protein